MTILLMRDYIIQIHARLQIFEDFWNNEILLFGVDKKTAWEFSSCVRRKR